MVSNYINLKTKVASALYTYIANKNVSMLKLELDNIRPVYNEVIIDLAKATDKELIIDLAEAIGFYDSVSLITLCPELTKQTKENGGHAQF